MRSIEGALRGLPEGSCLYQYTRVMSGFDLPRQAKYANPITEVFASDRLSFLNQTAAFRRIDLHWCLTLEPSKAKAFERKPHENAIDTSRMLSDLEKSATILQSHLGSSVGLRLLDKTETFQFFSYLFNLEDWAEHDQLRGDTGVDRQIVKSPVEWHSEYLQVGKRHVQMFSLKTTPEASRPCLFSGLMTLDCLVASLPSLGREHQRRSDARWELCHGAGAGCVLPVAGERRTRPGPSCPKRG